MRRGPRWEAQAAGLIKYRTDAPCVRGHVADRFVSNGTCVACAEDDKVAYLSRNRDQARALERAWRAANAEKIRAQENARRALNPEPRREATRTWRTKNPTYLAHRRKSDLQFRIAEGLRTRFRAAYRCNAKAGSAVRDLGCTIADLKVWLESQFTDGMTWASYGQWHIDHKKPLSAFDLTDRAQVLAACHWTNLQPLWAIDNLKKGARLAA